MTTNAEPQSSGSDDALILAALRQVEFARAAASPKPHGDRRAAAQALMDAGASHAGRMQHDSLAGYEIVGERHRGGQGVVYEAVQLATKRRVAIKVLYEGPRTGPTERRRFEREIEILSQLRHANIVTVFDSGEADGRFYYVMDLVDGAPLDRWTATLRAAAEASSRGTRDSAAGIVRLFVQVCDAVNAAHLRGVIHRDLKPGNILIDKAGQPRVLDFGLAKFTFDSLEGATNTAMTQTGQFVGSLPWSSPEQAGGDPSQIDTRTDVYAIGVMCYQALTGRFPYRVVGSVAEVLEQIRSVEPEPLSTRGGSSSGHGWKSAPRVDNEIETIVLKCLQKDRARRYQTAGDVGRDLQRYLNNEPIEAKRDSFGYVLRKQLRRYRYAAAAAGAVFLVSIVGFGVSLAFWRQADAQRERAEKAGERARVAAKEASSERDRAREAKRTAEHRLMQTETVMNVMQSMFGRSADASFRGANMTVREMLDEFSEQTIGKFAADPELELALQSAVSSAYLNMGENDSAEPHVQRALELAQQVKGDASMEYASARNLAGSLKQGRGDFAGAAEEYRLVIAIPPADRPEAATIRFGSMSSLAAVLERLGKYEEAAEVSGGLVAALRADSSRRMELGQSLREHGIVLAQLRDLEGASLALRESIDILLEEAGDNDTRLAAAYNDFAELLSGAGKHVESRDLYRKALAIYRATLGDENYRTATCLCNLGLVEMSLAHRDDAERLLREALAIRRRVLEPGHVDLAVSMNNLAWSLEAKPDLEEAAALYREALGILRDKLPPRHRYIIDGSINLARVLLAGGDAAGAEALLRDVLDARRRSLAADDPALAMTLAQLATALLKLDRADEAEPLARECLEIREKRLPPGHWLTANSRSLWGDALLSLGRLDEADAALCESYEALRAADGAPAARVREAADRLVRLGEARGDAEAVATWRAEADRQREREQAPP